MAIYEVKCGVYRSKGQIHKRGALVDSDKDLLECFPGKFILVDEGPTAKRPEISVASTSPSEPTGDSPERRSPEGPRRKKVGKKPKKAKTESPEEVEVEVEVEEDWDDLTDEFSNVEGLGVSVLYNGKQYKIVDTDTDKVLSENEKLKKSKDVKLFLKKLIEE